MNIWECCGKTYVPGVKACKKCGAPQKQYGIIDKPRPTRKYDGNSVARSKDTHISKDDNQLFVSTLKMKGE